MEKLMRNAPSFAVLVVLIIQVTRVSAFGERLNAGFLAPVFAVFLAGTIYVLSYWQARTKYTVSADRETERAKWAQQVRMEKIYSDVRRTAGGWLAAFVIIEGLLNLAETMADLPEGISYWVFIGALMYGIFPTLAAFGLGNLQALLDRVPHGVASRSALQGLFEGWLKRMEMQFDADAQSASHNAPSASGGASHPAKIGRNADAYPKVCPHGCGASLENANAYTAHVGRWCPVVREKNAQNAQADPIRLAVDGSGKVAPVAGATTTSGNSGEK